MKKISFNDEYGLQREVLRGRKTMTRSIVPAGTLARAKAKSQTHGKREEYYIRYYSRFQVGDKVAIAQSYEDLANSGCEQLNKMLDNNEMKKEYTCAGWNKKMLVNAELMPHHIRITDVRVEPLQNIGDEDCMREGIDYVGGYSENYYLGHGVKCNKGEWLKFGNSPREAFASLIDAVSGKGTWERNPLVYVYEFELID